MKAVVCCGDEVLLVRHTYARRDQWDIPGGYVRAGEEASVTLHRELGEELGIEPLTVVEIAEVASRFDRKRERIHVFAVEVAAGCRAAALGGRDRRGALGAPRRPAS